MDEGCFAMSLGGRFRGVRDRGAIAFRGITYATYERLSESVICTLSSGIVDAIEDAVVCPQRESRLAALTGTHKALAIEEGRLCLSIYVPDIQIEKPLPVMVWIHGGAFLTGGSEDGRYSGRRLSAGGNVIVVKISYRLGALGYMYAPDMGAVNLGLKDQQLALQWVHDNISEFGGDPDNVTLFGQSSGANSIAALIAEPGAGPYFRKAILQSPSLGIGISRREASKITSAFLTKLGKNISDATVDEILDAQDAVKDIKTGLTFMPVLEGFPYVNNSFRDNLKVLVCCAAQDGSPYAATALGKVPNHSADRVLASPFGRLLTRIITNVVFVKPARAYAKMLRKAGIDAEARIIYWHPKDNPFRACHCIELPFLMGEYEDWLGATMLDGMTREEFERNSAVLIQSWATFAREGSPRDVELI